MAGPIPLRVALRRAEVLHFLGYPEGRHPPARTARLLDELLPPARDLVAARGGWRRLAVADAAAVGLEPIDAAALVVGLVTVGSALEEEVSRRLGRGDVVAALILDAAGSAAAEEAADALGAVIAADAGEGEGAGESREAAAAGGPTPAAPAAPVSCRVSPGYGAWPLQSQPGLFALLPHVELGVTLLPTLLMVPRKSISFAMWLGADVRPLAGLSGCARCELTGCRYRRRAG